MKRITITKPDDWHLHLRDDSRMASVVMHTARIYKRALVMPNLRKPVINLSLAKQYRDRIVSAVPAGTAFCPLMTLYLTQDMTGNQIREAKDSGIIHAIKLYPAGATTNSAFGVRNIDQCDVVLETMQKIGMPLSVHGEVTDHDVDIFDREKIFIDQVLQVLTTRYPNLKIVLEHVTTREAVDFIESTPPNVAATITAHHMLLNRNDLLVGGIKPHHYCLPILKSEEDRVKVLKAATSGNPKFFLGTDSAPHARSEKESGVGKAGIYSAPVSIALYVELFAKENALKRLEGFCSFYGADFYSLPRNQETITLKREERIVSKEYPYGDQQVVPLKADEKIMWNVED